MKKLNLTVTFIIILFISSGINAQLPVIVKHWAYEAGNQDSLFKTPVINDEDYTYVATFTVNTGTGADVLIIKLDINGDTLWTQTWTGPGNGRDQASDIEQDDTALYISGITYTSVTNNFDFLTLCIDKENGVVDWSKTYNGTASSYDVASSITINHKAVYVTGTANNTSASLDFTTVAYHREDGTELWHVSYDNNSLMDIPFDISMKDDSIVVVAGGSQYSIIDWDYATLYYDQDGLPLDTKMVSGSAAGFDRATAVKCDPNGNIYITGTVSQSGSGYDIKTIKINSNGTLAWQATYNHDNSTDEGNDLIVNSGDVYVCGSSLDDSTRLDFMVLKYNNNGTLQWQKRMSLSTQDDEGRKMCLGPYEEIIVTGKMYNPATSSDDIYTVALDKNGDVLWSELYDTNGYDDVGENVVVDSNGNIFVTGQYWDGGKYRTVTIKYRTDYYIDPQQVDTPAVANYFYTNFGQIADQDGNSILPENRGPAYYTIHHYPQLYFSENEMNMVFSKIDQDTSTADTLQRVDVSFASSGNPTLPYPVNEMREGGYYNYFLAHCSEGITDVKGNEKLLYTDV